MRKKISGSFLLIIGLVTVLFGQLQSAEAIDPSVIGGIKARLIGPATMSGRITVIEGVAKDPKIVYVGTAGGGVWKSANSGTTFSPIFKDYTMSIGSIAIDQNQPDTLWVGTGECSVRNSVSIGDGIYSSKDAGRTWECMGLKETERISRVLIHPKDAQTVYAAGMGHLWNANPERGVFKTTDGGKTWTKIFYIDENTGCSDLEMDPQEPEILYAAMWDYRRSAYFFNSGGPGSGLYKTMDGGKTWKKLSQGLPKGNLGRIGIALAPSRPSVIYATVEAKETALYRSMDTGLSWEKMNDSFMIKNRPFYYSNPIVDPSDYQRIYFPCTILGISTDGGKSVNVNSVNYHLDVHSIWINPRNPDQIFIGTDGGVYYSQDRGQSSNMVASLPVSQIYHVRYDMDTPYQVYGGLQDNGSWMSPSQKNGGVGILNKDWDSIGGGDGFYVIPHPQDPQVVYYSWQNGSMARKNLKLNESKDIKPLPVDPNEPEYRFNWNAAMAVSRHHPDRIYAGAQFLFRSSNRGDTWEKISPDLTTNDPQKQQQAKSGGLTIENSSAENHCTIFSICESPKDENIIWVGTDDGNLQLTRDGGKTWTNQTPNLKNLPKGAGCSMIDASPFDPETAWATFDNHQSGDMKPYVYKTTDGGKTWISLASEAIQGYCHCIRQDLVNPKLVFLGTEFGLYVSIDSGNNWLFLKETLPRVSIRDMVINPREHDLIIATHGLGIAILDDLTPLRAINESILNQDAAILPSRPVIMQLPSGEQMFLPSSEYIGENPNTDATITYYLKKRHIFGKLDLEILDPQGQVIQKIPTGKRKGLNQVVWGIRGKSPKVAVSEGLSGAFTGGPMVAEGTYTVRLTQGEKTYTGTILLMPNPMTSHTPEDRQLRHQTIMKLYHLQEDLGYFANQIKLIIDRTKEIQDNKIAKKLKPLTDQLTDFHEQLVQNKGYIAENKLNEKIITLYSSVNQFGGKPSDSQLRHTDVLKQQVDQVAIKYQKLLTTVLPQIQKILSDSKLKPIIIPSKEEYLKQ